MVERDRALHLVTARTQKPRQRCNRSARSPLPLQLEPVRNSAPLAVRLRWYLSLRYWRQACAICCVNAATFVLWELAVR